eukprot:COSAG06_NODE_49506_length_325_cov_0.539823_1_plen_89_part_10
MPRQAKGPTGQYINKETEEEFDSAATPGNTSIENRGSLRKRVSQAGSSASRPSSAMRVVSVAPSSASAAAIAVSPAAAAELLEVRRDVE